MSIYFNLEFLKLEIENYKNCQIKRWSLIRRFTSTATTIFIRPKDPSRQTRPYSKYMRARKPGRSLRNLCSAKVTSFTDRNYCPKNLTLPYRLKSVHKSWPNSFSQLKLLATFIGFVLLNFSFILINPSISSKFKEISALIQSSTYSRKSLMPWLNWELSLE